VESAAWEGHYEFTIPTIARHLGFGIADLARPGPLLSRLLPQRQPLYDNTPTDPSLGPGTFIFRPARFAYFHERPEEFHKPNRLYHPIKPAWPVPVG
jgi:hypothetical protein